MTDDEAQREIDALGAALTERARLLGRQRELEEERDGLERTLAHSGADVDEATLDRVLARLGSIERERAEAQRALETQRELDRRYATAIHRKYERIVGRAPEHAVLQAVEPLIAEGNELRARLTVVDQTLHWITDAEQHLGDLRQALAEADGVNTLDALTPGVLPLEIGFRAAKQASIRAARESGARAKDALIQLAPQVRHGVEAARASGPTPPFALTDEDLALLDGISGDVELWLTHSLSKSDHDSRKLQQSVAHTKRTMLEQRRQLEARLAELTRAYHQLIAAA